jgi:DNA-directed RNA polymerase specialized sigma24 family protein
MAWTFDGASPAEIGEALKLKSETVRASLKKARAALRNQIDQQGGEIT